MKTKAIIKGLLTFIPGIQSIVPKGKTGGTNTASYCYGVWLKHLTLLWENGLRSMPNTIAELGPGDSLGVGFAAMLCGVNHYYALDVVRYSRSEFDLEIFDELVELFRSRAKRPRKGWPDYDRYLDENLFPSHILTDALLKESLSSDRVAMLRNVIKNQNYPSSSISFNYMVPWSEYDIQQKQSVDLILSHTVLQYVTNLNSTFQSLTKYLKIGGLMSHQVDFGPEDIAEKWNGHWACSQLLWKIIRGQRTYFMNRLPCSAYTEMIGRSNLKILCHLKMTRNDGIERSSLVAPWKDISDDDLNCPGLFFIAEKIDQEKLEC